MKIVQCHNRYSQVSGEDLAVLDDAKLLRAQGHDVIPFEVSNSKLTKWSAAIQVPQYFWNRDACRSLRKVIDQEQPDILHITNTFPQLSPSVFYATQGTNIPIVLSIHNFRFACPNSLLYRNGQVCEKCFSKTIAWPCAVHKCYRGSFFQSAVIAGITSFTNWNRIWQKRVDAFVTVTSFVKEKMIEKGFPEERIFVKPNLVSDEYRPQDHLQNYAVFAGRLDEYKGVRTLLDGWKFVNNGLGLKIIGQGELEAEVRQATKDHPSIEWLGPRTHAEVMEVIQSARLVVFPSKCYETFGRTIIEAFACGIPVVTSRLGAPQTLIDEDRNGKTFEPGNATELAESINSIVAASPEKYDEMRQNARAAFEKIGTESGNYQLLMNAYEYSLSRRKNSI